MCVCVYVCQVSKAKCSNVFTRSVFVFVFKRCVHLFEKRVQFFHIVVAHTFVYLCAGCTSHEWLKFTSDLILS